MRTYLLGFCIIVILSTIPSKTLASYAGIEILSEEYHVDGSYNGLRYVPNPIEIGDSYSFTGSSPKHGRVEGYGAYAESSANAFSLSVSADGGNNNGYFEAIASGTWDFRPVTDSLDIMCYFNWSGVALELATITLKDTTLDSTLLFLVWDNEDVSERPYEYTCELEVDINHEYNLSMHLPVWGYENAYGTGDLTVLITPEPATLLLLGLGGILIRRRK